MWMIPGVTLTVKTVPVLGEPMAGGSEVLGKELQLSRPEVLIGRIYLRGK